MLPVLVLSRFPFLRRGQIPGLEKIQGDWTQRRGWVFQATSQGAGRGRRRSSGLPVLQGRSLAQGPKLLAEHRRG